MLMYIYGFMIFLLRLAPTEIGWWRVCMIFLLGDSVGLSLCVISCPLFVFQRASIVIQEAFISMFFEFSVGFRGL